MNKLIVKSDGTVFFNNIECENASWTVIDNYLKFTGDTLLRGTAFTEITDQDVLDTIEDKYIQTRKKWCLFGKNCLYIPKNTVFTYKERRPVTIKTTNFVIVDYGKKKWMMINYKETDYGFIFGSAEITRRIFDSSRGWVLIELKTPKRNIQLYITKAGEVKIIDEKDSFIGYLDD